MKIAHYSKLIEDYLEARIDSRQFEEKFLSEFKSDQEIHDPTSFAILDELFSAVDAFCPDAELRRRVKGATDEQQLSAAARRAYEALRHTNRLPSQASR